MRFSTSIMRNIENRIQAGIVTDHTGTMPDLVPEYGRSVRRTWWPALVLFLVILGCAGRPLPSDRTARPAPSDGTARPAPSDTAPTTGAFKPGQLPVIRIGLLVNRDSASLTGTGRFRVVDRASGEVIGTSSSGQIWRMQAKGAWIDVSAPGGAAQGLYTGPIDVNALGRDGRIKAADREYRGSMEVVSNKNGKLTVVNIST